MANKPKLHYTNGRGKMESIRWLLATAGVEFEEEFVESRKDYERLLNEGVLLFEQVPMVEIDGMNLVQTKAILNYIAAKYDLYGNDLKERALIDMYIGGTTDLLDLVMIYPFLSGDDQEKRLKLIIQRATNRYFPVYEKVFTDHRQDFLVGNKLSCADVHLLEAILAVEEYVATILSGFPLLQLFKRRMSDIPTIKNFLKPGSQKKPLPGLEYVTKVKGIFQL